MMQTENPENVERTLELAWETILAVLGLDPYTTPGLQETPARAARALRELTAGYQVDVPALFKTFEKDGYDELVVLRDIEFSSLCEHHVLPFTGRVHIGYIPDQHVLGLSKLARVVEAYSRRLQTQERMTAQIADALETNLVPRGVMVITEGVHTCMALRGVRKPGAVMMTSAIRGRFWEPEVRAEGMHLLLGGRHA